MAALTIGTAKEIWNFDPRTFPRCELWIDIADTDTIGFSGSNILTVADKSGNGRNSTANTNRPTYNATGLNGKPTMQTVANNDGIRGTPGMNGSSALTAFMVGQVTQDVGASTTRFLSLGPPNVSDANGLSNCPVFLRTTSSDAVGTYRNGFFYGLSFTPAVNTPFLGATTFNPGELGFFYGNGVLATGNSSNAPTTNGTFSPANYGINCRADGTSSIHGTISEIILYSTQFTTLQRQTIEGYLAWKWGLQANLPITHPYRLQIPYARTFNPLITTNCTLWFDVADYNTLGFSGSTVTSIQDKSGRGNNTTSYTGTPAYTSNGINGFPSINFTATSTTNSQRFRGPISNSTASLTLFFVASLNTASAANARMISLVTNSNVNDFDNASSLVVSRIGTQTNICTTRLNTNSGSNGFTNGVPFIRTVIFNGTTGEGWSNSTVGTTSHSITSNFGYTVYGLGDTGGAATSSGPWNGHFGELIVYNYAMSQLERNQVEGYLANKWGIRSSLDTSNTFRTILLPDSPVFLPSLVSNANIWLDGSDPNGNRVFPAEGSTITTWIDKTGNNNDGTGGVSPTYSLTSNAVVFNGTNQFLPTTYSASFQNETIFLVATLTGASNGNPTMIAPSGNGGRQLYVSSAGAFRVAAANVAEGPFGGSVPLNQRTLFTYTCTSGSPSNTIALFLNGSNVGNGLFRTFSNGLTSRIGNFSNTNYWPGRFHEIIGVSNVALDTTLRQQVEGYLAWKWSLQTFLPTTHPYYKIKI